MKVSLITLLCLLGLFLNPTINKAQMTLPQASPLASLSQTVGITDIKIEYHKPSVKGRVIWGNIVPYYSIWRTGANEATLISFSTDVEIEGKPLAKGIYAIYCIPGNEEWTVILNDKRDKKGAYTYEKELDVLSFKVKPVAHEMTESFLFQINDITLKSCTINLDWEKLRIPIKIKVDTDNMFMKYIREFINGEPDDAAVYRGAAQYTLISGLHYDKGLQWADSAIIFKSDYEAYWIKGNLLAKTGKYLDAIEALKKGMELAEGDKDFAEIKNTFNKAIAEFKSKIK